MWTLVSITLLFDSHVYLYTYVFDVVTDGYPEVALRASWWCHESWCSDTEWMSVIGTKRARKAMISDEGAHVVYKIVMLKVLANDL